MFVTLWFCLVLEGYQNNEHSLFSGTSFKLLKHYGVFNFGTTSSSRLLRSGTRFGQPSSSRHIASNTCFVCGIGFDSSAVFWTDAVANYWPVGLCAPNSG